MMFNQQKVIQNGVKLNYDLSLGFYQTPIRKNAYFISDDNLIYPSGKHLVNYELMKKKQSFILKDYEDESISAMNFYFGKQTNVTLIAVGLKSTAQSIPIVRVYYISKNFSYNLIHSHLATDLNIIDVAFLIKGKYLVTLVEMEHSKKYYLTLWIVDQEKFLWGEEINTHITQVEVCLSNPRAFSVSGPRFFKIFKYNYEEKEIKYVQSDSEYIRKCLGLGKEQEANKIDGIKCHCWLKEDNLLVICKKFQIFVFRDLELIDVIEYIFPHEELLSIINDYLLENPEDEQANALNYLAEINKASGGKFKEKSIPDLIMSLGMKKHEEQKNLKDNNLQPHLNSQSSLSDNQKRIIEEEHSGDEQEKENGENTSNENKESNKHILEEDNRLYAEDFVRYDIKWGIFDEMSRDQLKEFLINKDEDILEVFHYIYLELMNYFMRKTGIEINCICKQDNGFAVGLNGCGIISLFKEDKNRSFILENSSKIQKRDVIAIHSLSSSFDNSHIAVVAKLKFKLATTLKNDVLKETDGILDLFVFNSSLVNAIKVSYKEPFVCLNEYGPHSGPIKSIAVAPTKTVMATLSGDKTLKFWNYTASEKQLFSFDFIINEQCFDLHPLLIQCTVGFKEGIKIFFLLENDLKIAYESYSKSCKAIKYSEGGHLMAVGFASQIHIISPYRLKTVKVLPPNHSGQIIQFSWLERDRYLLSLCSNSSVIVWDTRTWDIYAEHYMPNKLYHYISVEYDVEFDILVCCSSDKTVRFYKSRGTEKSLTYKTEPDPTLFTKVLISKKYKVCFFGCADGSVKVFLWPFLKFGSSKFEYIYLGIHQSSITDMKLSYNLEHLITASEDGSIYFLKITEIQKGKDVSSLDPFTNINEQKVNKAIGKLSNTFNLNEFALLSSDMEQVYFIYLTPSECRTR